MGWGDPWPHRFAAQLSTRFFPRLPLCRAWYGRRCDESELGPTYFFHIHRAGFGHWPSYHPERKYLSWGPDRHLSPQGTCLYPTFKYSQGRAAPEFNVVHLAWSSPPVTENTDEGQTLGSSVPCPCHVGGRNHAAAFQDVQAMLGLTTSSGDGLWDAFRGRCAMENLALAEWSRGSG